MNRFKRTHHFQEIGSTNTYVKQHINQLENYAVVSASHQFAGRGRMGQVWLDEGSALFSICIKDALSFEQASKLGMVAAASVYDVLASYIEDCSIKWPNDLMVEDKKIAGILLEVLTTTSHPLCVIIGVGINIMSENIASKLDRLVTSLYLESPKKYSIDEIIDQVLEAMEHYYKNFIQGGDLAYQVCKTHMAYLDQEVRFKRYLDQRPVIVRDWLESGELLVEMDGLLEKIHSGEVEREPLKERKNEKVF